MFDRDGGIMRAIGFVVSGERVNIRRGVRKGLRVGGDVGRVGVEIEIEMMLFMCALNWRQ